MTVGAGDPGSQPMWTRSTARWLIVAVHAVILIIAPITASVGLLGSAPRGSVLVVAPLGLGILVLQLRHSFAIARGERPAGMPWTLSALAVLVFLPSAWLGWSWASTQACISASAPLIRPRLMAPAVAFLVAGDNLAVVREYAGHAPVSAVVFFCCSVTLEQIALPAALYGSALMVRNLAQLQVARDELIELAIGRERLRVSRDLHDLLGHSLSAISLKGELAMRLLRDDPPAAHKEIEGLTSVARGTLRGLHAVARGEHLVSLRQEMEAAVAVLTDAGIDPHVEVDVGALAPSPEHMLGWAVREGVTNVVRHSQARTCWIEGHRGGGHIWLEIVNDGAAPLVRPPAPAPPGNGIIGLTERAAALAGSVSAGPLPPDRFRLFIELPEES